MELVKVEKNEILLDKTFIKEYQQFQRLKLEIELKEKEFKEELKEAMEEVGKTEILLDGFSATYRKGTTKTTIDSKRLKAEMPEIAEKYSKTSEVGSSIIIKCE